MKTLYTLILSLIAITGCLAQNARFSDPYVREHFTKREVYITMRDGIKLFTSIYTPRDASSKDKYPILMQRTSYIVAPYGEDKYPARLGPSETIMREGYIFVYQDVRGRWGSSCFGPLLSFNSCLDAWPACSDCDANTQLIY